MVADCLRVARRGIFLTIPNRWFPVEFHTQLPLLHWLPNDVYRPIYRAIGLEFFADEAILNLMTKNDLMNIARPPSGLALRDTVWSSARSQQQFDPLGATARARIPDNWEYREF
jgi:hypothetical protein